MTVALLTQWGPQPPGTLFNSDNATEAAMIAAKVATATLGGAVAWSPSQGSVGLPNRVPTILAQSAKPIFLLSSATNISATGAITGLTALPYDPTSLGVVQVFMFAVTGLVAGLYYARFSSTTACQLYLDAAGTVTPNGITPGAYAGGTTEVTLSTITVPGGSMGPNGALWISALWHGPNNANTKNGRYVFAGGWNGLVAMTTAVGLRADGYLRNAGAQNVQIDPGNTVNASFGATGTAPVLRAVDTSVNQNITFTGQLVNSAADYLILAGYTIEVLPGA